LGVSSADIIDDFASGVSGDEELEESLLGRAIRGPGACEHNRLLATRDMPRFLELLRRHFSGRWEYSADFADEFMFESSVDVLPTLLEHGNLAPLTALHLLPRLANGTALLSERYTRLILATIPAHTQHKEVDALVREGDPLILEFLDRHSLIPSHDACLAFVRHTIDGLKRSQVKTWVTFLKGLTQLAPMLLGATFQARADPTCWRATRRQAKH